jgi:PAS domain S-box-containing protein
MNTSSEAGTNAEIETERLRLEIESLRNERDLCSTRLQLTEKLLSHTSEPVFALDSDGRILEANPAACSLLGYGRDELLKMRPWDFATRASWKGILELVGTLPLGAPVTVKRVYLHKHGEQKTVHARLARENHAGKDLIVVSSRYVSERNGALPHSDQNLGNLAESRLPSDAGSRATEGSQAPRSETLSRSDEYLRLTIDTLPTFAWCNRPDGSIEFLNRRWFEYTGLSKEAVRDWSIAIHPDDLPRVLDVWQKLAASGEPGELEARLRRFDGLYRWFLFRLEPFFDELGNVIKWYGTNTDIDDRKWAEGVLSAEKKILELITRENSLSTILEALCGLVEEMYSDSLCAILFLDAAAERLRKGVAPHFPAGFIESIDGVEIGPRVGSCGTAAYRKETVVVSDINTDPLWVGYRDFALGFGLQAGWSTPIFSATGNVLGTFAVYYREPRSPAPQQRKMIEQFAHVASIAIEHARAQQALHQNEEALLASEQLARGQVEALIYSLDVLATASEPEKFLDRMLSTICRQLSGQTAALWLYNELTESMTLHLLADSRGTLDFQENHRLAVGPLSWGRDSGYQELLFAASPILCEDVANDPRLCGEMRDYLLMTGAKKLLAVPILAEGRVRGMVTVRHAARLPYRTEEVELAQALAHQVMLAIRLTEVGEQSRQAAVLAERNRMARDVHDTLAQGFTGVIVQLEAAEYAISEGDREDADQHLRQAGELARSSLSEARRSVHALRPQALEEVNFWEALKGIIKNTTVGTTLQTGFETKGDVPTLPLAWQENLLRIGQEALSNTLKYAHAKQFWAQFTSTAEELCLELSDDGYGFRINERHDGVGLSGMRERVQEMGGELRVLSSPGNGTKIIVILRRDPEPAL